MPGQGLAQMKKPGLHSSRRTVEVMFKNTWVTTRRETSQIGIRDKEPSMSW